MCTSKLHTFTARYAQVVVVGRAAVTFLANDTRAASTAAKQVTLPTLRAELVALTQCAHSLVVLPESAELTVLAVRSFRVAGAIFTVTAVPRLVVQSAVEMAFGREAIAITSYANQRCIFEKYLYLKSIFKYFFLMYL